MILSQEDPSFGRIQNVKRRFFALRNGVTADVYRRAGAPHKIIFGLDLVQLRELSLLIGEDAALAEALWANDSTRESRLLASMLYPAEAMDKAKALEWARGVMCLEEADVLCHRLLRRLPFADELIDELADDAEDIHRYVAMRLIANRLALGVAHRDYKALLERELSRECPMTGRLVQTLLEA